MALNLAIMLLTDIYLFSLIQNITLWDILFKNQDTNRCETDLSLLMPVNSMLTFWNSNLKCYLCWPWPAWGTLWQPEAPGSADTEDGWLAVAHVSWPTLLACLWLVSSGSWPLLHGAHSDALSQDICICTDICSSVLAVIFPGLM